MLTIGFVLLNTVGYMISPLVGFLTTSLTLITIFGRPGRSKAEKFILAAILTLPLYAVPILQGLHHLLSWSTLVLFFLTVYLLSRRQSIPQTTFLSMTLLVVFSAATYVLMGKAPEEIYYVLQFFLFVIPVVVVYCNRDWIASQVGKEGQLRLLRALAGALTATGIAVLVQAGLNVFAGIEIGFISYFATRVTYDITITAFSVVSAILAAGLVIAPMLLRRGLWLESALLLASCSFGILVNSSRTGLVVGSVVLIASLLIPLPGKKSMVQVLAIFPAGAFVIWLIGAYSSSSRGAMSLLDENGRMETFESAISLSASSLPSFILGVGFGGGDSLPISPHNFVLEHLVKSGLIVTLALVVMIGGLLKFLWKTEWQYPVWALLGGGMFFSGFYAVKAAVVIAIVMIALRSVDNLCHPAEVVPPEHRRRLGDNEVALVRN